MAKTTHTMMPNKNKSKQNNNKPKKVNRMRARPMDVPVDKQFSSIMDKGYGKTLSMFPGTAAFAKVYTDPFSTDSARIPVFPIVSSSLERYYATGKGSTNANGNGWITCAPLYCATQDAGGIEYSNAGSGDGVSSGFVGSATNSPHPISSFYTITGNYSVRVVAFGIRVRYLGSTLNAAGSVLAAQMSPLGDSAGGETYDTTKQLPGFKEYTFRDQKWHSTTRHIEATQDTFFCEYDKDSSRWIFPDSNGAHPWDENYRMFMYIAAGPNQPFEWEVVGHYELVGINLPRRGVTQPDSTGMEQVVGTMTERRHRDSTTPDHNGGGTWSTLVNILKEGAKTVIPMIPSILSKILL